MTPEERKFMREQGLKFCTTYLPSTVVPTLAYGILTPIAVTMLFELCRRRSLAKWQFGFILLGVISFTAHILANFYFATSFLQIASFELSQYPAAYEKPRAMYLRIDVFSWVIDLLQKVQTLGNDALIIWRAYIIFERREWTRILCFGLWAFASACLLAGQSLELIHIILATTQTIGHVLDSLLLANAIGSFLTNAVATSLIAFQLLSQVKFLRRNLDPQNRRSFKIWRVLVLLVDSGAVYGLFQLVLIILNIVTRQLHVRGQEATVSTFTELFSSISFVYLALTIALIQGSFSIGGIHGPTSHVLPISSPQEHESPNIIEMGPLDGYAQPEIP